MKGQDSGFGGGFRSQSVSNLFQGFFGVKHAPASMTDITSGMAEDKSPEEKSLETIISPSHDESWLLTHFLQAKREKEDDGHMRRNVTWSELGKSNLLRDSTSSGSSTTDISRTELVTVPRLYDSDGESSGSKLREKNEEPAKPKIVFAKDKEHPHYHRNILSSFLSHDLPNYEARRNIQIDELEHSQLHQGNTHSMQAAASVTGEVTGLGDKLDGSHLPDDMTSGDKIHESKQMLRDLLWSFNHEKINVSKKEMNMIASIDQ